MPKAVKEKVWSGFPDQSRYMICCPGCYENAKRTEPDEDEAHWLLRSAHVFSQNVHQFNGDLERPTLSPSLLMRYTWGDKNVPYVCHSFVRDGTIQFLRDCTHPLANQTVDLLDCSDLKQ